jgi:diguanylate cyclase (GGDEF)-like protein
MPPDGNDRLRIGILIFAACALPLAIGLAALVLHASLARQTQATMQVAAYAADALHRDLALHELAVESIVANAEHILAGRQTPTVDVVAHLEPVPAHSGYSLRLPPGYTAAQTGSLMGEGAIPAPGSAAATEMAMAFALAPSLGTVQARGDGIPWAYYVSRRGFLYIHPRAPEGAFLWEHALLDRYTGPPSGAQLRVEGPRMGWSRIYEDVAGKGLMTTVSKLVVHRGELVGDVSIDVGMSTLLHHLDKHGLPDATMHLLAGDGTSMLPTRRLPGRIDLRHAPLRRAFDVGDAEVIVFPIGTADWHLAIATPRRARYGHALRESAVFGLMALFMLASLGLLVALTRTLRRLVAVSVRDPLTGVYNRRHFDECAPAELAKARRAGHKLALLLVDVDHFKKYNDHYGHPAGDRALRDVATGLRASLQRASDLLFRVGGEEFAVLAWLERPEQLRMLGDKLCAAMRAQQLPHGDGIDGRITLSIGATLVDDAHGFDLEVAYREADAALYRAKQEGRDRVVVT